MKRKARGKSMFSTKTELLSLKPRQGWWNWLIPSQLCSRSTHLIIQAFVDVCPHTTQSELTTKRQKTDAPKQFRKCVHAACVVRASVLSGWSAVSYAGRSDNPGSDDHPRDRWVQESLLPRPCHLAKGFPPIVRSYANNKRVIYCCFTLSGTWYLLELIELIYVEPSDYKR